MMNETNNATQATQALFVTVQADTVAINCRARAVAMPKNYFFEIGNAKRALSEYNETEKFIERGLHQVDATRASSESAIMPDYKRFAETNNAFPADASDTLVDTADKYKPRVAFAHRVFAALVASDKPQTACTLATIAAKGFSEAFDKAGKYRTIFDAVASHVMRDCALYGFAIADSATHRAKTTLYTLNSRDAIDANFSKPKAKKAKSE